MVSGRRIYISAASLFSDSYVCTIVITHAIYSINIVYTKASGSKLNKNKTKGLWLGAWKNRKDNYKFGIDFVESIKIVGFKIGNNVTQDDIWHPIYVKFENVLKLWKFRHLSLLEKSLVVNVLATSKI